MWRKKWAFKGFGLTLKGDHDFKLYESTCAAPETFEALYGVRDDGDIYYPDNIKEFCNNVKNQTNGLGVHFVMADGVCMNVEHVLSGCTKLKILFESRDFQLKAKKISKKFYQKDYTYVNVTLP